MKTIFKNKRGGFLDLFLFIIVAVILVLASAIFIYAQAQVEETLTTAFEKVDAKGININQSNVNYTQAIVDSYHPVGTALSTLRWISFFLIIGMIVSVFIGSFMVTTRPVFFIPYIFLTLIAVILAANITNAYETIMATDTIGPVLQTFSASNFILMSLPLWVAVIGIGGAIVMFARMGAGGFQQ